MSFTKTFPYNTGTFVIIEDDFRKNKELIGRLGSIACYQCVSEDEDDEFIVMVSGYKDSWCGEYLLSQLRLATKEEVDTYKYLMGIKE